MKISKLVAEGNEAQVIVSFENGASLSIKDEFVGECYETMFMVGDDCRKDSWYSKTANLEEVNRFINEIDKMSIEGIRKLKKTNINIDLSQSTKTIIKSFLIDLVNSTTDGMHYTLSEKSLNRKTLYELSTKFLNTTTLKEAELLIDMLDE